MSDREYIDLTHRISDPLSTHGKSKLMPNDNKLGRIVGGKQLTDLSINCAQRLLKKAVSGIKWFKFYFITAKELP